MTCVNLTEYAANASFAGIGFEIESSSEDGARDVISHTFVKRDDFFNEDLGAIPLNKPVSGRLAGTGIFARKNRLERAFNNGAAYLYDPLLRSERLVRALNWGFSASENALGEIRFSVTFVDEGKPQSPAFILDELLSAPLTHLEDIAVQFERASAEVERLKAYPDRFKGVLDELAGTFERLTGFHRKGKSFTLKTPSQDDITGFIGVALDSGSEGIAPQDQAALFNDVFETETVKTPPISSDDVIEQEARKEIDKVVKTVAISRLGQIVSTIDYTTAQAAKTENSDFLAKCRDLKISVNDYSVYEAVSRLESEVNKVHKSMIEKIRPVIETQYNYNVGALESAWQAHQDPNRADEVYILNGYGRGYALGKTVRHYAS